MSKRITFIFGYLELGQGKKLRCYLSSEGNKCVGITKAPQVIRRSPAYLSSLIQAKTPKYYELKNTGFNGSLTIGALLTCPQNTSTIKALDMDDFVRYIAWEALYKKRKQAIQLLEYFKGSPEIDQEMIDDQYFRYSLYQINP